MRQRIDARRERNMTFRVGRIEEGRAEVLAFTLRPPRKRIRGHDSGFVARARVPFFV
jgi:hypothetical protein